MPPMSIAGGQAPPHHIPGHSYMGPLPPSLMGPRNGGGGAPTFPPNPIQPGQVQILLFFYEENNHERGDCMNLSEN